MARCELGPEQPQPIPISSVLRGTESESDLERTKRSSAARCVHSWSHSLLKTFFLRRPLTSRLFPGVSLERRQGGCGAFRLSPLCGRLFV